MSRIAVIFNPHAKLNAAEPERADRLSAVLDGAGEVVVTDDREQLAEAAAELAAAGPDLVGMCGGDGTFHIVLSALIPAYRKAGRGLPTLALLRGGSMNTNRWNLNLQEDADVELAVLRDLLLAGRYVPQQRVPVLRVSEDAREEMYGFIWGVGYATNLLDEYYSGKWEIGPWRAVEMVYRVIAAAVTRNDMLPRLAKRFEAKVSIDGEPVGFDDYGAILAGTLEAVGIGFRPLYRARRQARRFHVLTTGLTIRQLVSQVHRVFAGKPLSGEPHRDQIASSIRVAGEAQLRYQLDGELYEAAEIAVDVGPEIDIASV